MNAAYRTALPRSTRFRRVPPSLSFVIPTYNRRALLPAAVDSALTWLDAIGAGEIVIVDDGSTDGTGAMLAERYAERMAGGQIRFHVRERNGGVAAAKNTGAGLVKGDWIVFLDSDDEVIPGAVGAVVAALDGAGDAPVVFFRCVDLESGALIGKPLDAPVRLDLDRYARWAWGECLPAMRPAPARQFPFVTDLPGFEGVSYFRTIPEYGPLLITPIVARRYRTEGDDRVSAPGRRLRAMRVRKYVATVLGEFGGQLSLRVRARLLASYFKARLEYWVAGGTNLFRAAP